MTTLALSFNDVNFLPVQQDGQIWLSSIELAQALDYKSVKSVSNLYNSNKDEFTDSMTQVIESVTSGNYKKKARIFSLRGCHLIAMFARTDVAKQFRKWVLDILDREVLNTQIESRQSISPEQQALLHEIVARRSGGERKIYAEMWARHNRHFKIPRYAELLAIHFPEAVHYLETMDVKAKSNKQAPLFDQDTYERVRSLVEAIILENDEIIPVLLAVKMIDERKFLYYANKVVRANERARDLSWALDFRNKLDEPLIDENCRVIALSTGQRFAARSNWFNAPG